MNQLIKGIFLFLLLGLLSFLFTVYLEYFFWFNSFYRTVLFVLFVGIEGILLLYFIITPILHLVKLKRGISKLESSRIIGNYFPEVQDKLTNVLQLKKEVNPTELLTASIEQKSSELDHIQFTKAIHFKKNYRYLRYLIIPSIVALVSFTTEINTNFTKSIYRVANPQKKFVPPVPFVFHLSEKKLSVVEGDDFTITFTTKGSFSPSQAKIHFKGLEYLIQKNDQENFYFTFTNVTEPFVFRLHSAEVFSPFYKLNLLKRPLIQNIRADLSYPSYTKIINQTITDLTSLSVPEGTRIQWHVSTRQTDSLFFISNDQRVHFDKQDKDLFTYHRIARTTNQYQITSSNTHLKEFERLFFTIEVLEDEHPMIRVLSNIDRPYSGKATFTGQISDDYGISDLRFFYYDSKVPNSKKCVQIKTTSEKLQSFFYEFSHETLSLEEGIDYEFYFEVFDNDPIHSHKSTLSRKFHYRKPTSETQIEQRLKDHKKSIQTFEKSSNTHNDLSDELLQIERHLLEQKDITWNDKNKISEFINRQENYHQLMQHQTEKILKFLQEPAPDQLAQQKDQLRKRMEEFQRSIQQQQLLNELQRMAEKLDKVAFLKRVERLSSKNHQQFRSLKRILELTKRFYVEEKTLQIANQLKSLSEKQSKIHTDNFLEQQPLIETAFESILTSLDEVQKDNLDLREPMELPTFQKERQQISQSFSEVLQNFQNKQHQKFKKNRSLSSEYLSTMSQSLKKAIEGALSKTIDLNLQDLRKILEDLIIFSFRQEDLLLTFQELSVNHPSFSTELKKQHQLQSFLKHIDDSLFVLSLRVPELSLTIQEELPKLHSSLDQSLENLVNNQFDQATSNQQFTITAVNNLTDLLSDLLTALQNSTRTSKRSSDKGFSLPTLIELQKGLSEQMSRGLTKKNNSSSQNKNARKGSQNSNGMTDEQQDVLLLKIYQQQNTLKNQLLELFKHTEGSENASRKVTKSMEALENQLLQHGLSASSHQKMLQIEAQLLQLNSSSFIQGTDNNRQSSPNTSHNSRFTKQSKISKKQHFNWSDLLQRQSLPLHKIFKEKVDQYFQKKM